MCKPVIFVLFISVFAFLSCAKTTDSQMHMYLETYYPTSGTFSYQIAFDWGEYDIHTGANVHEKLSPEAEPYRGFITLRPSVAKTNTNEQLKTYLVTPEGVVWTTIATDIPATISRKEVLTEKTQYGTSTTTKAITSSSEPVIDHFLTHKDSWKKYGTLNSTDGTKFKLTKLP